MYPEIKGSNFIYIIGILGALGDLSKNICGIAVVCRG